MVGRRIPPSRDTPHNATLNATRRAAHAMTAGTIANMLRAMRLTTIPPIGQTRAAVDAEEHDRIMMTIGMTIGRIVASSSHAGVHVVARERTTMATMATTAVKVSQAMINRASTMMTTPAASTMRPTRLTIRARHEICGRIPGVAPMRVVAARRVAARRVDRAMTGKGRRRPMGAMVAHVVRPKTPAVGVTTAPIADVAMASRVCCRR